MRTDSHATWSCSRTGCGAAIQLTRAPGEKILEYDFLVGGLFVPILGGLLWKRATGTGAWTAMIAGTIAVVIGMFWFGPLENEPIYIGHGTSLAVFVVISLLTPPTPQPIWQAWRGRLAARKTSDREVEAA